MVAISTQYFGFILELSIGFGNVVVVIWQSNSLSSGMWLSSSSKLKFRSAPVSKSLIIPMVPPVYIRSMFGFFVIFDYTYLYTKNIFGILGSNPRYLFFR